MQPKTFEKALKRYDRQLFLERAWKPQDAQRSGPRFWVVKRTALDHSGDEVIMVLQDEKGLPREPQEQDLRTMRHLDPEPFMKGRRHLDPVRDAHIIRQYDDHLFGDQERAKEREKARAKEERIKELYQKMRFAAQRDLKGASLARVVSGYSKTNVRHRKPF